VRPVPTCSPLPRFSARSKLDELDAADTSTCGSSLEARPSAISCSTEPTPLGPSEGTIRMVAAVVTAAGSGAVLNNADDYVEARVEPTPGSDDVARRSKLLGASLR
jgi:hypothetical protein